MGGWWNYRFIEHKEEWTSEKTGNKYYDITFGIKEVYYRGDGSIMGWAENDISLGFYGYKEVKTLFKSLKKAAKMTVLKEVNDKMIDTGKRMKDYTEEELCNFDWKKEMQDNER